jgi:hypothetical protein
LKAVAEVALEVMSSIVEGARATASGADNRDGSDVSAVATGRAGNLLITRRADLTGSKLGDGQPRSSGLRWR